MTSFTIRSRRVLTPKGLAPASVHISNGKIQSVDGYETNSSGEVNDVGNDVVMPGLIDAHVHINEPGRTEWEGFTTATQAAAAGGITTIMEMPLNSIPVTTTKEALEVKMEAARSQVWVNCGFYGGVVPTNISSLVGLANAGVFGCKAFLCHSGIDEFPNATEGDLNRAMPILSRKGIPLLVHAELCDQEPHFDGDPSKYSTFLSSRPRRWENNAIELVIALAKKWNCKTHIVHLSSADAIPLIAAAKDDGVPITAETCPHYLTLSAEEIPAKNTTFKCAPPIREKENQERLWAGLQDGTIDFIAADHSPCTPELKKLESGDFKKAWGGIASLQFELPIVWTAAKRRGISIEQVCKWLSTYPARFLGLQDRKGAIAPGMDADLFVWSPESSFTLKAEMIRHRNKITPYLGQTLTGEVRQTFVRGVKVFDQGEIIGPAKGELLCNLT